MDKRLLTQIQATREAGTVRRCHIVQHHGLYNMAQHSYGAASLLLLLHPAPSRELIKATLWHDVGERWLGDMPAPAKWENPTLGAVYEEAERQLLRRLGLLDFISEDDHLWLKAVDTLDLWLWCREEEALGSNTVTDMRLACEKVLDDRQLAGTLPAAAFGFYATVKRQPYKRLSDLFGEAMHGFGEAEA